MISSCGIVDASMLLHRSFLLRVEVAMRDHCGPRACLLQAQTSRNPQRLDSHDMQLVFAVDIPQLHYIHVQKPLANLGIPCLHKLPSRCLWRR